jgi:hypothetical protein
MKSVSLEIMEKGNVPLSLELPETLSFEAWQEIGRKLCSSSEAINWWIGDWWASGQHRYGDRARAAADGIFGRGFQTLQNTASVCRAFETSRRREVLSYSHHVEVASLPSSEADVLLDRAQGEGWSVRELRAAVGSRRRQPAIFTDIAGNDADYASLARLWNQADIRIRFDFLQMLRDCGAIEIRDVSKAMEIDRYRDAESMAAITEAPLSVCRMIFHAATERDVRELRSDSHEDRLCRKRHAIAWVGRERAGATFAQIGKALNRDHSVIVRSHACAEQLRRDDEEFRTFCDSLALALKGRELEHEYGG